jgi:hypothetical protein
MNPVNQQENNQDTPAPQPLPGEILWTLMSFLEASEVTKSRMISEKGGIKLELIMRMSDEEVMKAIDLLPFEVKGNNKMSLADANFLRERLFNTLVLMSAKTNALIEEQEKILEDFKKLQAENEKLNQQMVEKKPLILTP